MIDGDIDGDNVSHRHAQEIAASGRKAGEGRIHRAYADVTRCASWDAVPGVNLVHSGGNKNGSDLLLSIDAMELALTGVCDSFVIARSDRDFTHVATRLRERRFSVVGVGEAKSPRRFRVACTRFEELAASDTAPATTGTGGLSKLDWEIRTVIAEASTQGMGMRLCDFATLRLCDFDGRMRARFDVKISALPEGNWRTYLTRRPDLFDVDPKGPDAHVRFKRHGFGD